MTPLYISLAGSLGAVLRFMIDGHIKHTYRHGFPWATLLINTTGSLLLGMVTGFLISHRGFASNGAIIGIGFCGGYTTFSTASFETVRLLEQHRYRHASLQAIGGLVASVLAAAVGLFIGQLF